MSLKAFNVMKKISTTLAEKSPAGRPPSAGSVEGDMSTQKNITAVAICSAIKFESK